MEFLKTYTVKFLICKSLVNRLHSITVSGQYAGFCLVKKVAGWDDMCGDGHNIYGDRKGMGTFSWKRGGDGVIYSL